MFDFTGNSGEVAVYTCAKCSKLVTCYLEDKGGYYPVYDGYLCTGCKPSHHLTDNEKRQA